MYSTRLTPPPSPYILYICLYFVLQSTSFHLRATCRYGPVIPQAALVRTTRKTVTARHCRYKGTDIVADHVKRDRSPFHSSFTTLTVACSKIALNTYKYEVLYIPTYSHNDAKSSDWRNETFKNTKNMTP